MKKLLEPINIGAMELRNRMAMPPMTMSYANANDGVSRQEINYFVERSKGGVGLIIVGGVTVEGKLGKLFVPSPLLRIDDDIYVAGFSRLADAIHDHGAKAAIQLYHAGRQTTFDKTRGEQPISSSDAETALLGVVPAPDARAMTVDEIEEMEELYVTAALRAKTAGFDAVLIDGGGGYGIAQFMSPFVNKRTDEYGGDLDGRMRFPLRIVQKIKETAGNDLALLFDIPPDEFVEGGITIEESLLMARMLEDAGIQAFRLHPGVYETYQYVVPPAPIPKGYQIKYAQEFKRVLKKAKVMVGHRIHDPQMAEEVLAQDKADMILLGRPLIADPEFPKKVAEGRADEVRKCISCNIGCVGHIASGIPASCTVNPMVGKEEEYRILPTESPKKVLVIGGGVGGMEAARVASIRGHQVTLLEKSDQLGGMANVAAIAPFKSEIKSLIEYLSIQLEKQKIEVRLGREITADDVLKLGPDAVIVATGAIPDPMEGFPGLAEHPRVVSALDVLLGKADTGDRIAIIGGGLVGLEVAEILSAKGKQITVLEMQPDVGMNMEIFTKALMVPRLMEADVDMLAGTKVDKITKDGVVADGEAIDADTVILAVGMKSNQKLFVDLKGKVPELHAIGDCVRPRRLMNAIHDGANAARQI